MKKIVIPLILITILAITISCSKKEETIPELRDVFFSRSEWNTIQPLMEDTEKMVKKSDWDSLLSTSREIAASFSVLTESLNKIETSEPDYTAILKLQIEAFSTVAEVFKNNLADMDNLNKLLTVDSKMASTKASIQKYKKDLPEGYFHDLSGNNEKSDYLLNWGSRLISIIQNKILTGKEVKTQEDIKVIKTIIEKAEKDNRLEELENYLETEAAKDNVPPSILFSLSLVYGRKGLVKKEYKTIERLEKKVKQTPKIAFNLSLVYGRKKTLKSQIDKAEAEARALLQGFISVTSTPAEAEVYIDGVLKGTTPFTTKGLKEGSYSVEIRKDDYSTIKRTVVVKAKKTAKIEEELTLLPGSLTITSTPTGSTVLLNGKAIGKTPLEVPEIKAGKHKLVFQKDKYQDEIVPVIIEPGKGKIINTKLIALTGNIYFSSLTDGAQVYLDGKRVYPQNNKLNNIPAGYHTLLVKKDRYKDKRLYVTVEAGKTEYRNCQLEKSVFNIPFAKIKIDGKLDDWEGIEPIITDPSYDKKGKISGTDITKVFLAKNNISLFFRMDFADGKPSRMKEMFYECVIWADSIPSGGQYFIEIRLYGNSSNSLKPYVGIQKLLNNQNTGVTFNENGSYRTGDHFFEARFPISDFKKYVSKETSYKTEMRAWRSTSIYKEYDKTERVQISFALN